MKYSLRIRAGFTIVEVALAATILLVGFAGMAEALIIGSGMLDTARKQTIAARSYRVKSNIGVCSLGPRSQAQALQGLRLTRRIISPTTLNLPRTV